jgi:hypothetical protein
LQKVITVRAREELSMQSFTQRFLKRTTSDVTFT